MDPLAIISNAYNNLETQLAQAQAATRAAELRAADAAQQAEYWSIELHQAQDERDTHKRAHEEAAATLASSLNELRREKAEVEERAAVEVGRARERVAAADRKARAAEVGMARSAARVEQLEGELSQERKLADLARGLVSGARALGAAG